MAIQHKFLLSVFFIVLLSSLWSGNIYVLVLFSALSYILLPVRKTFDYFSLAILTFSICYVLMLLLSDNVKSNFLLLSYLLSPLAFYRFGQFLIRSFKDEDKRVVLLLIIVVSYMISIFIFTILDISMVGIVNHNRTLLGDNSNAGDSMSATLYGLMTSVGIGCVAGGFFKNQSRKIKFIYLLVLLLSILVVVHLINRTGIIVLACTILFILFYKSAFSFKKIFIYGFILILLSQIINYLGVYDSEIIAAYQDREANEIYGFYNAGGRVELWISALDKLVSNPMGWYQRGYVHNLWLDLARLGGWLAFFPFLISTIIVLKTIIGLVRIQYSDFSLIIISLNVSMILASVVEPVIEGSISFFCLLLLLWGVTVGYYKERIKYSV